MLIIDYNGIAVSAVAIEKTLSEDLIRHMILNTIRMYKSKFNDYGEVVIAADGANNWRRGAFPQYKANRRKNREESTFDWPKAFEIINKVREEIKENFPYKVVHIEGCEADDVIGTLVEQTQEFVFTPSTQLHPPLSQRVSFSSIPRQIFAQLTSPP